MNTTLKNEEKAIFVLRDLYSNYGYTQYKMSKFEEYDLYVRNKDFLISDSIITFTDTNGKLLALKPDVTLSIIKNTDDSVGVKKVYYNENVYRVSKGTHLYKEIMQVGIECIGEVDSYCIFEVLKLASESLKSISTDCVLDITHLGLISEIINGLNIDSVYYKDILKCIGEKNVHELLKICENAGANVEYTEILKQVISTYGNPKDVLQKLQKIISSPALEELKTITTALESAGCGDIISIDFSVVNDMNYYNGIVFKGFINGIPSGILSGGQYDKLMQKMNRSSKAIGFAVYLDLLERLSNTVDSFDIDAILLYDDNCTLMCIQSAVDTLISKGMSVIAQTEISEKIKYKHLFKITNGEVTKVEDNA